MANTKLPNGPQQPRILQLMQWIANPLSYLDACAREYGDVFTLRLASFNPLVFLSHPQAIQEIFTADAKHFDSGRANGIVRPLVGEHSLLLLDGTPHQRQRRLLMPPFHGERMHSYSQLICETANQVASQWVVGQSFQVRAAMQDITLEVILHAVFGLREGERYRQLKPLLAAMLNMTDSPLPWSCLSTVGNETSACYHFVKRSASSSRFQACETPTSGSYDCSHWWHPNGITGSASP